MAIVLYCGANAGKGLVFRDSSGNRSLLLTEPTISSKGVALGDEKGWLFWGSLFNIFQMLGLQFFRGAKVGKPPELITDFLTTPQMYKKSF